MIEAEPNQRNRTPATATGGQAVLGYSREEPGRLHGALAKVAMVASLSFVPVVVVSILLGAGGLVLVALSLPLIGLVLGLVARGDPTADARARATGRRAAIWGAAQLVLVGLVALVLPNMGQAREPAHRIKCASNLRQIGQSLVIYANDYGVYPPSFDELLVTGDIIPEAFVCPSSDDVPATSGNTRAMLANLHQGGFCSYVYALDGHTVPAATVTRKHVLAYENLPNHDRKGMNLLYGDGHVDWVNLPTAEHVIAELRAGHNPPRPAP